MVLEATRIIEERKVHEPRSIDLAVILGLGFPVARGGLLRWADSLGTRRILAMLDGLAHLGPRVHPTPLLEEMARRRRRFYARAA
jgi:3-hydroxyacyl-CoA dehydrogenase